MQIKICNKCNIEKSLTDFFFRKDTNKYRNKCKDCCYIDNKPNKEKYLKSQKYIEYYNNYYMKNSVRMNEYSKQYRKDNLEYYLQYSKDWYKNNKEYHNKLTLDNYYANKVEINFKRHEKIKNDINLRILSNLRRRIHHAIKNNNKSLRTRELLGCTVEEFKIHLEKQFKTGMSWNNYGIDGWVIDHIIPCASFDMSKEEDQRNVFILQICNLYGY